MVLKLSDVVVSSNRAWAAERHFQARWIAAWSGRHPASTVSAKKIHLVDVVRYKTMVGLSYCKPVAAALRTQAGLLHQCRRLVISKTCRPRV
jgi:hypothetical protein